MSSDTESGRRRAIPRSIRFAVLKRDCFKCIYCGRQAPEVPLHIDHIDPVKTGGDNSIVNLAASCSDCNFGKGATKLSDQTALQKQYTQLEDLQTLKEQREMMMEWREELKLLDDQTLERLANYWTNITKTYSLTEKGRQGLRKLLRKFTVEEISYAMDESHKFLRFDEEGKALEDSVELAWSKVGPICYVRNKTKGNPELEELYKIQGFLKSKQARGNWAGELDSSRIFQWLEAARSWEVSIQDLRDLAADARSMTELSGLIDRAIEQAKDSDTTPPPSKERSAISTPEVFAVCKRIAATSLSLPGSKDTPSEETITEMAQRFFDFVLNAFGPSDIPPYILTILNFIEHEFADPFFDTSTFATIFDAYRRLFEPLCFDGPPTMALLEALTARHDTLASNDGS